MLKVGDKLPAGALQEFIEVEGNGCSLGPNSFAKTEYRYSNYEQGFEKHQVVAGFGFRF